jgi:hypothetical protein
VFFPSVAWLSFLLAFTPPIAADVEQAFLKNSARELFVLFPEAGNVNISLPEPFSFSDELSNEQAYFLIQRIFSYYRTLEFVWETGETWDPGRPRGILKARWCFRDVRNNFPSVYALFFFVSGEGIPRGAPGTEGGWNILEIKAERL